VLLVKSMREMSCEPYMGEQDVEIVGRWIKKVDVISPSGIKTTISCQPKNRVIKIFFFYIYS
jgi:hypothetical protein